MATVPKDLHERVKVRELSKGHWLVTLEVNGVRYSKSGIRDSLGRVSAQSLTNDVIQAAIKGLAAQPPTPRR